MTEITNRPTPESDAQFSKTCLLRGHRDFARRLEQQRDALRDELERVVFTLERNGWACARSRAILAATKGEK